MGNPTELKVEQSAEQTLLRLADENRVGLGERLKPRGEIRRVADNGTLLRGAEADDLADHDHAADFGEDAAERAVRAAINILEGARKA
jgi:hypothetical protein